MQSYAIANCEDIPDSSFYRRIARLVEAGIDFIQLRAKTLDDHDLVFIAARVREAIARGAAARFLVNGRGDIAVAVGADGVHLPANGLPAAAVRSLGKHLMVGRSCHSIEDCRRASSEGVDYLVLGPVFPPRSKEGGSGLSLRDLEEAAQIGPPVFALGGISRENMSRLSSVPIAGLAGITLFMKDEPLPQIVAAVHSLATRD